MKDEDVTYEYELISIEFSDDYECSDEHPSVLREDEPACADKGENAVIEYDADGIPIGRTKSEIKVREKIIKDFYSKWISVHPRKSILNKNINAEILVKYQSINETYNKAARSYASTVAVFELTDILENAELVEEVVPKSNKNQKQFEKILYMRYKNIKLVVGLQRSTQEHVQYSITVPQGESKQGESTQKATQ